MSTTTTAPATTATIGQELVGLCREGRNGDAIERLYSKDIVSIEPSGSEAMPAETKGIDAVHKKHAWWTQNSYGTSMCSLPFADDTVFAWTRHSQQWWFDNMANTTESGSVKGGGILRETVTIEPAPAASAAPAR